MEGPAYSPRLDEALALAAEAFRDKYRKGTTIPYLTHLLAVCALVGEQGGSEDQLIAALLHDYLEDIEGADRQHLEERFGPRVADWVEALSDWTGPGPKGPWTERKVRYLERLAAKPPAVKLLSAADKVHNCRSLVADLQARGPAVFERFTGGRDGTLWYYRALVETLGRGFAHPLVTELESLARQLHDLAREPWGPPYPPPTPATA